MYYSRDEMEAFLNSGKISGGIPAAMIRQLLASEDRRAEIVGQARLLVDTGFSQLGETVDYQPGVTTKIIALLDEALK